MESNLVEPTGTVRLRRFYAPSLGFVRGPSVDAGRATAEREQRLRKLTRGDFFGDQVVAATMIDRIVHHAEVVSLKRTSHRPLNNGIDTLLAARPENTAHHRPAHFPHV